MAELKTKINTKSVETFLKKAASGKRLKDCFTVLELMKKITKEEPKMWGPSIVGFGNYHYKYESGREGDFFISGFSPRKQNLTIYIMAGFSRYSELMEKLGKYKTGRSCLYIKDLDDIDLKILQKLITESVRYMKKKH
ncbi:MAG: hypothetical protein COW08_08470 [Ignavibacteriales bacterium CG12_big_fil_rev_8_21_14_0_65_30_8]|nr:MAG: hypothetical protein COW08_08470 [Ignavibacteriales bacterium CG12_big_fil_rev_8_21_14_0_65_30_8]